MKYISNRIKNLFYFSLLFLSPLYLYAQSEQAIEVKEAYKYVGETKIVCGRIVSTKYLKRASGGPIFLNFGGWRWSIFEDVIGCLYQLFYYTKHPMTSSKIDQRQPPKFLSILGADDVYFDEKKETITMGFNIGEELTHSEGAFVQGGFITAMLDTSMAHLLIFKTNGAYNPLTLNINVNFLAPGTPGKFTSSATIKKTGKSISYTSAELHQGETLVATASATNKFLKL